MEIDTVIADMLLLCFLFCVMSSEVLNATETANALYHRWQELISENANVNKEDYNWTTNELRNCLRSIEWDLEDLEETVYILYWLSDL